MNQGQTITLHNGVKVRRCGHCGGQLYSDDPKDPQSDIWCLLCGSAVEPPGYQILPYVPRMDEPASTRRIHNVDDLHDLVTEYMFETDDSVRPSDVAKKFQVTTHDVTLVLERLRLSGFVTMERYGPGNRFIGYRRVAL